MLRKSKRSDYVLDEPHAAVYRHDNSSYADVTIGSGYSTVNGGTMPTYRASLRRTQLLALWTLLGAVLGDWHEDDEQP